jgi:hypothetical protein
MAYSLGPVKSHVKASANYYGPKYGIKTVYGFGGGSVAASDHPRGLALDFMINNIPNGRSVGDALAAELLGDPNVKYVIWYVRINTKDGRGWRHYTGPRNHKDHVHASYNDKGDAPSGGGGGGIVQVDNPLDSVKQLSETIGKVTSFLTDEKTWHKLAYYVGGTLLLIIGFLLLAGVSTPGVKDVVKVATKVVKK